MPETLSAEARVTQFAERVARRDNRPLPDPARFEPAGVGQITGRRARACLERAGLLRHSHRRYHLTRFGDDCLLAVAQATAVPAPPVAEVGSATPRPGFPSPIAPAMLRLPIS
ncbi:hypothetical protein [Hymenobacter terricola]|uniref:hypothetical protein n=1 Tax=Hymenobacter terricola TaxID=2819236 RepID=UPI001B317632|nr:hypothetical protein [Hymenobacter terricola]